MRTFFIIWTGQLLSLLSTAMTGLGLTIWAWQQTQRATALALVGVAHFAPMLIFSPIAGALVDRVFEPAMQVEGILVGTFAPLIGSGPGAGMTLMIVGAGLLSALVGVGGFFFPAVRHIEPLIPDHDVGSREP